jgi:hypothetical protein|tara:strand:- start:1385 stop:1747 length:363 start_codon:yes stop_codon:yes gene_type:complete
MAKKDSVESIRFDIEDLLSEENLMDPKSVGVLQDMLNKYVFGADRLEVDGTLGPQTVRGIQQYRNESRYWGGHSKIKINPLETYKAYLENKAAAKKPSEDLEDLPDEPWGVPGGFGSGGL